MTDLYSPDNTRRTGLAAARLLIGLLVVSAAVAGSVVWLVQSQPDNPPAKNGNDNGETGSGSVGGVPLFSTWPKEHPELVLVISGQTFGYLSPCGCSRPQKGGLERRANFIEQLRSRGWEVIGLDLGDASPAKGIPKQNQLKFRFTMQSLASMGYAAIGLGENDFSQQLLNLLAEYTLQNPNKRPIILAGNLLGAAERNDDGKPTKWYSREEYFPGGPDNRPMVEMVEVIAPKGKPAVGVIGLIGKEAAEAVEKLDSQYTFASNEAVLKAGLAELDKHEAKPEIKVLLYGGSLELAQEVAKRYPQFSLIVCQTEESEPPQFPTQMNDGKTLIVQVGHKGQNVGTVGFFRSNGGKELEMQYQLIPLGEEYLTPEDHDAEKDHEVLRLLEEYAKEVKKADMLSAARAKPLQHPVQIQHADHKPTYVGAQKCAQCHAAEFAVWKHTKHSHAYEALEKYAQRPSLRQYDPECVVCHTTGFQYVGGFANETESAFLKGNQCENCHGPGSAHSERPNDTSLYAAMMPWRTNKDVKLPDQATLKKIGEMNPLERNNSGLEPEQVRLINTISGMCMKCHDSENDPKFDFYEYYPQIYHSGLKNAGLPPGAK